jgi:hypothetical protein
MHAAKDTQPRLIGKDESFLKSYNRTYPISPFSIWGRARIRASGRGLGLEPD